MAAKRPGRSSKRGEVEYPCSDGKPMESDLHRIEMWYSIYALKAHFRDVPDVYVSGNLFIYYVEGEPRYRVAPDTFVAKGVPNAKDLRDLYKVWEEGQPPCFVLEITAKSTRTEDLYKKKGLYRSLGVEEYLLYDPLEEYLSPSLQGFRLAQGPGSEYLPLALEADGSLVSSVLGVVFRREGQRLRLIDARTGDLYLHFEERSVLLREAQQAEERAARQADQAAEARRGAEQRVAQLAAELARLRQSLE